MWKLSQSEVWASFQLPVQLLSFKAIYTFISNVFAPHTKLYQIITNVDALVGLHTRTVLEAALWTNRLNWDSLAVGNSNLHWKCQSLAQCFWESFCQYCSFPSIRNTFWTTNSWQRANSKLWKEACPWYRTCLCESSIPWQNKPQLLQSPSALSPFHVTETPHRNDCDAFMPHLLIFPLKKAQKIVCFQKHTNPKHKT